MKTRDNLSALLVLALLAGTLACQTADVTEPESRNDPATFESLDFAVVDAEDAFSNVQDATIASEMVMNQAVGDGPFDRNDGHPGGPGSHLGVVLRHLNLTDGQVRAVRSFALDHRVRVRDALEGIRRVNLDTIRAANEERREILERLDAGEITREEAGELLRALSDRTRDAIRANPLNEPYLRMICVSIGQLFADIRSILGPNQQAAWDDWVAGLDHPCV
jgi:hypothetical protein